MFEILVVCSPGTTKAGAGQTDSYQADNGWITYESHHFFSLSISSNLTLLLYLRVIICSQIDNTHSTLLVQVCFQIAAASTIKNFTGQPEITIWLYVGQLLLFYSDTEGHVLHKWETIVIMYLVMKWCFLLHLSKSQPKINDENISYNMLHMEQRIADVKVQCHMSFSVPSCGA